MIADILIEASLILLIGGMVFFPIVVAPTVFTVFDDKTGGHFLRALFPRYYLYILAISLLGLVGALIEGAWSLLVYMFVFTSTLWVRQTLVPKLNGWRDAEQTGDEAAGRKFKRGHRLSVIINMIQLTALVGVAVAG